MDALQQHHLQNPITWQVPTAFMSLPRETQQRIMNELSTTLAAKTAAALKAQRQANALAARRKSA
jgi:hypothetical protein